jgi:hypothetical protein
MLPTASRYLHRLQWSRQIEDSYGSCQSSAVVGPAIMKESNTPAATDFQALDRQSV